MKFGKHSLLLLAAVSQLLHFTACGPGKLDDSATNMLLLAGLTRETCFPPDSPPVFFTNGQAANTVIGQIDFTSNTASLANNAISGVQGNPAMHNGVLYLSDYNNNRVLGFNGIPTTNGAAADFVLGAPDFNTGGSLVQATQPSIVGDQLFVTDYTAQQVRVFRPIPTTTTVSPTYSITGASESTIGFFDPETAASGCGKLALADSDHNRVLLWNNIPTSDGQQPDLVLGQFDFGGSTADQGLPNPTASTLDYPAGIWTDGMRLVVADNGSNRVLIWNSWPNQNGQPADLVLGQYDFTTRLWNHDMSTIDASSMYSPYNGVFVSGSQIFVADSNNNRVLIWNSWPTQNGQPADTVIGSSDFVTNGSGLSANAFNVPRGLFLAGTTLIVGDFNNNRYLLFNGSY